MSFRHLCPGVSIILGSLLPGSGIPASETRDIPLEPPDAAPQEPIPPIPLSLYGCVACHQGINIGGNMYQKFGVFQEPGSAGSPATVVDLGRYATKAAVMVYRVNSKTHKLANCRGWK
jgi:hypothetical protein